MAALTSLFPMVKTHDESNEDITFDPEEELDNPAQSLKKLREKLRACQTERQEYLDTSQRLRADYLNLKREAEKEKEELARFAKGGLLIELLDLADSFELAFGNREVWESVNENWRRGIEYIYSKLVTIFEQNGLTEINPLGQDFNPAEHHALATIDVAGASEDNKVLAVIQKGYRLHGRVIRPAKVKLGHK